MTNMKKISVKFNTSGYPVPVVEAELLIGKSAQECEIQDEVRRLVLDNMNYEWEEVPCHHE